MQGSFRDARIRTGSFVAKLLLVDCNFGACQTTTWNLRREETSGSQLLVRYLNIHQPQALVKARMEINPTIATAAVCLC